MRSVDIQGLIAAKHPRRQDKVRVSRRVIGMKMRAECYIQVPYIKLTNPRANCRGRATYDSGSEIDKVRYASGDYRYRWTRPVGVGVRRAGSEKDYSCAIFIYFWHDDIRHTELIEYLATFICIGNNNALTGND